MKTEAYSLEHIVERLEIALRTVKHWEEGGGMTIGAQVIMRELHAANAIVRELQRRDAK